MQVFCLLVFLLSGMFVFSQDFQVTELSVPHNNETLLGSFSNNNELLLVFKKSGGKARFLHKRLDVPSSEFREVDISGVSGDFYREAPAGTSTSTIRTSFITNPDAFYFETAGVAGPCGGGGSYRIKDGRLEVIAVSGQEINLQTYEGINLKTSVECAFVANPLGTTGDTVFRLRTRSSTGRSNDGFVRKTTKGFVTLLSASISEMPPQYPYPYALSQSHSEFGVWGDENKLFFMETDRGSFTRAAEFDLRNKKLTRLYDFGAAVLNYIVDPSTGERRIAVQLNGSATVFNFPKEVGKPDVAFATPAAIEGFGSAITLPRGPTSKEMTLFGIIPRGVQPLSYKAVAFWSGTDTVVALVEGQALSSGNIVKDLNLMYTSITETWTSSGCRAFVPLFQYGGQGKLDTLVQIQTPCITEYPRAREEGTSVLLKGTNFTLGSQKVEVQLPGIGYTPAYDITPNQLTFTAAFGCNPCDIRVISGTFKSNVVRINFTPHPVPQPRINKLTDLYAVEGPAVPGKIMSLWGEEFCSFRSDVPLSTKNGLVDGFLPIDVPTGCRVLVDGREVGLYYAWTSNTGPSQINFVLPYDLAKGRHEIRVQKVDTRNGNRVVSAESPTFMFQVEDVNPTFFTTLDKVIVLQRGFEYIGNNLPALPKDILSVYLSGGGGTSPLRTNRTAGAAPFLQPVRIWVNDIESEVLYAGSQPESPGLEQINFMIPDVTPESGLGRLKIQIGNNVQTFLFNLDKL